MSKSVIIGLNNLVYAKLIDDPVGGVASYETPKPIAGAIEASVTPNASNAVLFADNGPYDAASALGEPQLSLNVADLPLEVQADLFGHKIVGGVLRRGSGDIPPWVAVGYKSLKSNGKYRYTWLLKGKFSLPEQANKTKADSVEFQTPTTTASFVKRDCDDDWQIQIDEDHVDYIPSLGANWFNSPNGGAADKVAPTITSVTPANDAADVAVGASVVWQFDEALALSTVTKSNFMVINDGTGASVPGSLSINAGRTQVTFTPADPLTAGTSYRAIVSVGVTDIAGNELANPHVTKFTAA